jgi:hypothetical protein
MISNSDLVRHLINKDVLRSSNITLSKSEVNCFTLLSPISTESFSYML